MSLKLPRTVGSILVVLFFLGVALAFTGTTHAHSGRTDANGGHNCYVGACAGTYHYHNGGGYTPPSTPDYAAQGRVNGQAHAAREAENIRIRARDNGYQTGYSNGSSGASQNYNVTLPADICDIEFTFDANTNATYRISYKSGWLNECSTIARAVWQGGYNQGFTAGNKAKPTAASVDTVNSIGQAPASNNDWIFWTILGVFVGVPLLGGLVSKGR
jgi:hypothetical protein